MDRDGRDLRDNRDKTKKKGRRLIGMVFCLFMLWNAFPFSLYPLCSGIGAASSVMVTFDLMMS